MLKAQKKYGNYLKTLQTQLKEGGISDEQIEALQIMHLNRAITEAEMLIPVVGAFSSGKSSLLNSFLGKDYLPVGITPETSLATELRYVADQKNQKIEAVKDDGSFDKYEIEQIGGINKKASSYKFMRLYLNSSKLKETEPLILVDMPGFHSPLDMHNRAILEYLNRGLHYIMLISVEDGIITKSMARKLQDITFFKRDISFFLSKANLRSPEETDSVKEQLIENIEDILDVKKDVIPINDNGGESLSKIIKAIDPETIFSSLFRDDIKDKFYSAIDLINIIISGFEHDKEENQETIENLSRSLDAIIQKRDMLISEAKEKYSDTDINHIVEEIGCDITTSADELVSAAMTGGSTSLQATLSDITQSSLLRHIQVLLQNTGQDIVDSFASELSNINMTENMSGSSLSDKSINKITDHVKFLFNKFDDAFLNKKNGESNKTIYRIITSVLAITTNIVGPFIELIILFLPDILNNLQKQSQKSKIKNQILTNVIPDIKRRIKTELPKALHEKIEQMIMGISDEFESKIQEKKSTLEAVQNEYKVKMKNIETSLEQYKTLLKNIKELLNEII